MSRRHYQLPPLTTLTTFEAAARHLSFKAAAAELGVTPGAVSHQIKALEGELRVSLFLRQHRGVALTQEGAALADTLAASFRQISRQLTRITPGPDGAEGAVTVGSTNAVAALWLSPAVIAFWRDYPSIHVHQVTQDRPFESMQGIDFALSYGRVPDAGLSQTRLFRDELVPVAAPDLAAALRGVPLEALAEQRLIHMDTRNPSWTTWPQWFAALGYTGAISRGTQVTSYSVALQIARTGAGVALGWRRLLHPMLESGKLAVVPPYRQPAPHHFYLAGLPDEALSEEARALKAWLIASVKSDELISPEGEIF